GTPDPDWKGGETRSVQEGAGERLTLANISVWLAQPARIPVEVVLHFDHPGDGTSLRQSTSSDGLLVQEHDLENQIKMADLALARELNEGLSKLMRNGTTWTAIRVFWKALLESMWEARYLLSWVAMEALFGSANPGETRFRLSQRAAFFLGQSTEERKEIFQ